jgi:two-component system, chemotaxis family, protein-glutamate methylesterase/glutaminase
MTKKIRVIVVDDSQLIRDVFTSILSSDPEIEVVCTAEDPFDAREKIKRYNPDVITLDVEMPKMDGLSFLEKIMTLRPMPVVMVSTLTQRGADITLRALEVGAVDCIGKPTNMQHLDVLSRDLIQKVKAAATIKVRARETKPQGNPKLLPYNGDASKWLIALGASTGGVEALREVLTYLPANSPPVVITQHMPAMFTKPFAERLDKICALQVQEAQAGMEIKPGNAYIAFGGMQFKIKKTAGVLRCVVEDGELVSGHKPSVDVLFQSVVETCPTQTVAAILTGMGKDGAQGMLALRKAGAKTMGESEASCIVYGMPRAAFELGGVEKEYHLRDIPREILTRCN